MLEPRLSVAVCRMVRKLAAYSTKSLKHKLTEISFAVCLHDKAGA